MKYSCFGEGSEKSIHLLQLVVISFIKLWANFALVAKKNKWVLFSCLSDKYWRRNKFKINFFSHFLNIIVVLSLRVVGGIPITLREKYEPFKTI